MLWTGPARTLLAGQVFPRAGEGKSCSPGEGGQEPRPGAAFPSGIWHSRLGVHAHGHWGTSIPTGPRAQYWLQEQLEGMDESSESLAGQAGAGTSLPRLSTEFWCKPLSTQPHTHSPGRLGLSAPGPCGQGCSVWAPEPQTGVSRTLCLHLRLSQGWAPAGHAAGRALARLIHSCQCRRTVPHCGSATGCPVPPLWHA